MWKISAKIFIPLVLLLCAADLPDVAAPEPPAGKVELAEDWKLVSAKDSPGDGATVSLPDYQDSGWHPIGRMPATVLQILQERRRLSGSVLRQESPRGRCRKISTSRTGGTARHSRAGGAHNVSLEFPGINYRAEIWLNGRTGCRQQADRRHVRALTNSTSRNGSGPENEHPGGQGHPGVDAAGHRRCGTGGQLV